MTNENNNNGSIDDDQSQLQSPSPRQRKMNEFIVGINSNIKSIFFDRSFLISLDDSSFSSFRQRITNAQQRNYVYSSNVNGMRYSSVPYHLRLGSVLERFLAFERVI